MIADGLTKALPRQRHEEFIKLIRLDDISERIQHEKRMEDLKDKIMDVRAKKSAENLEQMVFMVSRGVKTRGIH